MGKIALLVILTMAFPQEAFSEVPPLQNYYGPTTKQIQMTRDGLSASAKPTFEIRTPSLQDLTRNTLKNEMNYVTYENLPKSLSVEISGAGTTFRGTDSRLAMQPSDGSIGWSLLAGMIMVICPSAAIATTAVSSINMVTLLNDLRAFVDSMAEQQRMSAKLWMLNPDGSLTPLPYKSGRQFLIANLSSPTGRAFIGSKFAGIIAGQSIPIAKQAQGATEKSVHFMLGEFASRATESAAQAALTKGGGSSNDCGYYSYGRKVWMPCLSLKRMTPGPAPIYRQKEKLVAPDVPAISVDPASKSLVVPSQPLQNAEPTKKPRQPDYEIQTD